MTIGRESRIRAGLVGLALVVGIVAPFERPLAASETVDSAYAEIARHEAEQDARLAALEKKVPTPSPIVTPDPTAAPTPLVTPVPAPTPSPTTSPIACATNLQTAITAAPAGATLNATGCTYTIGVTIAKPITLIGATFRLATTDMWSAAILIDSDDVTIDRVSILDGGAGVSILGRDRVVVRGSTFRGLRGGAVSIWSQGRGADDVLVEGNDIIQTENGAPSFGVSPIAGRGGEDVNPCAIVNRRTTIRNNVIDQGPQGIGWFGVEFKCHEDVLIEGNTLRGGHALISLPDNNRVLIRANRLILGPPTAGSVGAYWGVEIAKAHDVTVTDNDCTGTTQTYGACVSLNSGSLRSVITRNRGAQFVHYLVEGGGGGIVITDNCIAASTIVQKFPQPGDSVARNGPCS